MELETRVTGHHDHQHPKKGDLTDSSSSSSSLLSEAEIEEFESLYPKIVERLIRENNETMPGMEVINDWLLQLLDYNVTGGKKIRGLMVPVTFKGLVKNPSPKDMNRAYVLGWIIEMLQAASLVADDLVDESETRRGKPCWYKRKDVGMVAVRDYRTLVNLAFKVLKIYFEDMPYYNELFDCVFEAIEKTVYGQALDCISSGKGVDNLQKSFTKERYNAIVKYKTSYYTMYFPVMIGLILARKTDDKTVMTKLESVLLEIGHYFQVQDDYLDCFGDAKETGKVGTDIQDNKCSWLVVQALEVCNAEELHCLLENYGKEDKESVNRVKELYRNLNLPMLYIDYELEIEDRIRKMIEELPEELDVEIFRQLFMQIYKRKK